ncbi:MAG: carbon-nitrogen hydrolase family protein [Anaerolineae bacterium]
MDIIAFPETNLTGYVNPEQHPHMVLRLDGPEVAQAGALTKGKSPTALVGDLEENPNGKPFISQLVVRDGRLVGVYRKMTQGEAEDGGLEDWHAVGESVPVFQHDALTFGIAICADSDNEHVFAECARQGARIVFEVAAPGLYGDQATRDWESSFRWWEDDCQTLLSRYAATYGIWIAVATQAGRTMDEDFPGGGYVFAPDCRCVFATPDWSAGMVIVEVPV